MSADDWDWLALAECSGDDRFGSVTTIKEAQKLMPICSRCQVRRECAQMALIADPLSGLCDVWAGVWVEAGNTSRSRARRQDAIMTLLQISEFPLGATG
jgi:hypothetical protein